MYTAPHPLAASHSNIFLLPNQGHSVMPYYIILFQQMAHTTSTS